MNTPVTSCHYWNGMIPPQYIFANRRFLGVALDPPDFEPGSWIGAGAALFDPVQDCFLLTARPRKAAGGVRGYCANVYRSGDGEQFELACSVSTEDVARQSDLRIDSIEGTQLQKDPLTGCWHFYLSVNTEKEFVWGGLHWETLLLTAPDPEGPWRSQGIVLPTGEDFDAHQARDSAIGVVDGRWLCLYKARDQDQTLRPALAISRDGVAWRKLGPLTMDGEDRHVFLNGTFFASSSGPLFIGLEKADPTEEQKAAEELADEHGVTHGGGPRRNFIACALDRRRANLEVIYRTPWEPGSQYEHPEHPLLGYSSLTFDPKRNRMLIYVEAIDPELSEHMGLNGTVERLLVYETPLPSASR